MDFVYTFDINYRSDFAYYFRDHIFLRRNNLSAYEGHSPRRQSDEIPTVRKSSIGLEIHNARFSALIECNGRGALRMPIVACCNKRGI